MNNGFLVGDYITDRFGIYEVKDIKAGNDFKGKSCTLLYYKPISDTNKDYVASIPIYNLSKTGLRKVFTSEEAQSIVDNITSTTVLSSYDLNVVKEDVYLNDPVKVIPVLAYIWINQATMSRVEKELMEQILEQLSKEISFATNNKMKLVKDDIIQKLNGLGQN